MILGRHSRSGASRRWPLLVAACLAFAPPARAQGAPAPVDSPAEQAPAPDAAAAAAAKAACVRSFTEAQALHQKGELLRARAELQACGREICPDAIRAQCVRWLRQVEESLPSIVVTAVDTAGNDRADVRVLVDGELTRSALDGQPLELDPGVHELRLELSGAAPVVRRIVVAQGERLRRLSVRFETGRPPPRRHAPPPRPPTAPAAPEAAGTPAGPSPLVYVGFGLGAAGLLAGTITGVLSLVSAAALEDDCPGRICPPEKQDDIDTGRAVAHASTASFALGAAGAATGLVALLLGPKSAPAAAARAPGRAFLLELRF